MIWRRANPPSHSVDGVERAAVGAAATAAPPAPAPPPPVPAAKCLANIGTDPPGAEVVWGGQSIGKTPLAKVAVPCGAGRVALERAPYLRAEKDVAAVRGATVNVFESLARPPAHLELTSTPADAVFSIRGKILGTAPVATDVLAFTTVVIVATRPGYKPWSTIVRTTPTPQTIHAQLQPASRTSGRR